MAQNFASAVAALLVNDTLWQQCSRRSRLHIKRAFSVPIQNNVLDVVLENKRKRYPDNHSSTTRSSVETKEEAATPLHLQPTPRHFVHQKLRFCAHIAPDMDTRKPCAMLTDQNQTVSSSALLRCGAVFINPSVKSSHVLSNETIFVSRLHFLNIDGLTKKKNWQSQIWVGLQDPGCLALKNKDRGKSSCKQARSQLVQLQHLDPFDSWSVRCPDTHKNTAIGPEDPRLFELREKLFMIFWDAPRLVVKNKNQTMKFVAASAWGCPMTEHNRSQVLMQPYLTELVSKMTNGVGMQIVSKSTIPLRVITRQNALIRPHGRRYKHKSQEINGNGEFSTIMNSIEKNWQPFDADGTLFAIWHLWPLYEILRVDISTGLCTLAHTMSSSLIEVSTVSIAIKSMSKLV